MMDLITAAKTWWQQQTCRHYTRATHTTLSNDYGALVVRRTVCLECGKSQPCPPIDDRELYRLLIEAEKLPRTDNPPPSVAPT